MKESLHFSLFDTEMKIEFVHMNDLGAVRDIRVAQFLDLESISEQTQ